MTRITAWLSETHNTRFELLRHFTGTLFDSESGAAPDEWKKAVIGVFAVFMSLGILVLRTFSERYLLLQTPPSTRLIYARELRSDEFLFVGIAMAITALLTLLLWKSLFPGLRDCLALAGLPVSARELFAAKFGSVLIAFSAYLLALNLPWAVLFAMTTSGHWQENPSALANIAATFGATAGACCFVFFSLVALQGLLLNILPTRVFDSVSRWIQAGLFIVAVGAAPLIGRQPRAPWWPGIWFLHFWEGIDSGSLQSAREGLCAIAVPAAITIALYMASYHRYRRILLEKPRYESRGSRASLSARSGAWVLEKWIPEPAGQAAFSFIWKTLTRSRGHRLILLAYAGLALGWIVKGAIDMPAPSLRDQGVYGMLITIGPLALSLLSTVAFRYLFSLPVATGANWLFQIADANGGAAWLAAVERFVIWCGIAPIFVASVPAAIAVLGLWRAAGVTVLSFLTVVLWFEALFREWRKMPFTCSFLPAKRPFVFTLVYYALAGSLLLGVGALILYCSVEPAAFVALIAFQIALWWKMMRSRRIALAGTEIMYEDLPEAAVNPLDLGEFIDFNAGQTAEASERGYSPAREELFSGSLTVSRGFLPKTWADEIAEERRHPRAFLTSILADIRLGLRLIRRNALVSAVVVVTLTAGIGINATVFTIVNGVALRPHVANPASFVVVFPGTRATFRARPSSYAEYLAFLKARSLRSLAAWTKFAATFGDADSGSPGLRVSCNFFAVEGVQHAKLGRLFLEDDCRAPGQAAVAILSESTWRERFGANPDIVGKVIRLNNRPVPVVGIVADGTSAWIRGSATGVWVPYTSQPWFDPSRDNFRNDQDFWLGLAGRVAPGFSREAVRSELRLIVYQQDRLFPGRASDIKTADGSLIEWLELNYSGRSLLLLTFFFGAFGLVLLISCANVATLLLSRAAIRAREIAVRLALGAPLVRLVRMLVTESVLLAALAGLASGFLVWKAPEPLCRYLIPGALAYPLPPDWRVFSFIVMVATGTGLLAGLAPAMVSLQADLNSPMKAFGASVAGGTTKHALGWLVSAQVAMSMVLLVEAGLLGQAEKHNLRGNPGYDPERVAMATLQFGENGNSLAPADVQPRLDAIVRRMLSLPGVRSAAFSDDFPLSNPNTLELRPPSRTDAVQPVDVYSASPGFFETLAIPLVLGRGFRESDGEAVIVSESLARSFWRRSSPVGHALEFPDGSVAQVMGVVKDVEAPFGGSDNLALYKLRRTSGRSVLSVRFDYGVEQGPAAMRAALRQVEPNIEAPVRLMQTWIKEMEEELWNFVSLTVMLGVIATLLSVGGIYGAVSFAVTQGTKEMGIRVALGATGAGIVRQVFLTGGKPVFRGLVVGLWLSVATAAALQKTLAGGLRVDSSDPMVYFIALLLLAGAAAIAMAAPAIRGAAFDPVEALRSE